MFASAVAIVLTASLLGVSIPAPAHADPVTLVLAVVAIAAVGTGGVAVANVIDCHVNVFWGCNGNGQINSDQICPSASNGGATGTYPSCICNNGGTYTSDTNSCSLASCTFNGNTIASGNSVTAYQSSSVSYGQSCVSQTRTCTNGTLSGSYTYGSCTVDAPASCTFNGVTIPSDNSVTAYSASTAVSPVTCPSISQTRVCSNGVLSGSYTYESCNVDASCTTTSTNSCDMYGTGFLNANGVCSATVPPDSSCPAPVIGSFYANPSRVNKGATSTLEWSVTNASVCAISGGGLSLNNLGITGNTPTNAIATDTTFTLNCADNLGPATSAQATVHLIPNYQEL